MHIGYKRLYSQDVFKEWPQNCSAQSNQRKEIVHKIILSSPFPILGEISAGVNIWKRLARAAEEFLESGKICRYLYFKHQIINHSVNIKKVTLK